MKQVGLNTPGLDVLMHRLRERDVSEWSLFLTSAQIKPSETAHHISSLFYTRFTKSPSDIWAYRKNKKA